MRSHKKSASPSHWVLRLGADTWQVNQGSLTIGRLDESDIQLTGSEISRRHATVVATAAGPLLYDRSLFGSRVNGRQIMGPTMLSPGDLISVGDHLLEVRLIPRAELRRARRGGKRSQAAHGWLSRFGLADAVSMLTAVLVAGGLGRAIHLTPAVALGTALAEVVAFYLVLTLRELGRDRAEVRARFGNYSERDIRRVLGGFWLEFGIAEPVDTLLTRPLCLWAGLALGGWPLGIIAGKVTADLLFYAVLLKVLGWQLARTPAARRVAKLERDRSTSASILPLRVLLDAARREEEAEEMKPAPRPSGRSDPGPGR